MFLISIPITLTTEPVADGGFALVVVPAGWERYPSGDRRDRGRRARLAAASGRAPMWVGDGWRAAAERPRLPPPPGGMHPPGGFSEEMCGDVFASPMKGKGMNGYEATEHKRDRGSRRRLMKQGVCPRCEKGRLEKKGRVMQVLKCGDCGWTRCI